MMLLILKSREICKLVYVYTNGDFNFNLDASISWMYPFHGCIHFMDVSISWMYPFHGCIHFMDVSILKLKLRRDAMPYFSMARAVI